jgi:hypothetical protein
LEDRRKYGNTGTPRDQLRNSPPLKVAVQHICHIPKDCGLRQPWSLLDRSSNDRF